jgi:hypothetical protein
MADHEHPHDHTHAHEHDHEGGDSYFIDQLCMVGLSGAFGVICLCLWFWKFAMLGLMLGEQFHLYVLLSGIVLTVLAFTRGVLLWQQSRDPAFLKTHDHDHAHEHKHDHAIQEKAPHAHGVQSLPMQPLGGACGHDHATGEACGHDHAPPGHGDHDEADHDHGWAPWRYVVILVPIILFLLGLPDKPPSIIASERSVLTMATLPEIACFGAAYDAAEALKVTGKAKRINFKDLELMAADKAQRDYWNDQVVEVVGQYSPIGNSNQLFMLVRFKISCCANDALQLNVPMASRQPITGISKGDWVKVTGRVEFREDANSRQQTVLIISKASDVAKQDHPDGNPYIQ